MTDSKRLLKAENARGLGAKVAFNYEDLRLRCDEHVEKIRRQTHEMLEKAHAEADSIRKSAFEESQEAGRRAGLSDADSEIQKRANALAESKAAEKLSTLLPAMKQAAEQLAQEQDRWLAEWETAAIRLSVSIAEKLLTHRLATQPDVATEMISEALQLVAGAPHIKLRLNPADLERLGEHAEDVVTSLAACHKATFVPDKSIRCGGCVVETQHGVVDARIETLLERIAAELIDPSSDPS